MISIPVVLKNDTYDITIGYGTLPELGSQVRRLNIGKDAVVITNPVIHRYHGRALISGLKKYGLSVKVFEVPPGERSKSAKTTFRLVEAVARHDCLKQIFIIAFGGGVIGDLAGFVAAIYKRGIPYIQVPTTLLAQVDSSIGGKVGIDLPVGKNLAGAFYQPKLVYSDVALLSTLPKRQIRNGLAEVIKCGVIADKKLFMYVRENSRQILGLDPRSLTHVVSRSSQIKRDVVMADERETKGVRTVLNFGHTVGHALEAAGQYGYYHHGEAIALGMRVAARISLQRKMCTAAEVALLEGALSGLDLPECIERISMADIFRFMRHDKKFILGKNRFVLMAKLGQVRVCEGITPGEIKKAIQSCR